MSSTHLSVVVGDVHNDCRPTMLPMNTEHQPHDSTIDSLIASILANPSGRHLSDTRLPDQGTVVRLLDEMRAVMFPGFFGRRNLDRNSLPNHIESTLHDLAADLHEQIEAALCYWRTLSTENPIGAEGDCAKDSQVVTQQFLGRLPEVRRLLCLDVAAAYDGDPAAEHMDEIVFCYPGVTAMMVQRLAHELYNLNVPLLPRIMTEFAHGETGIDIHPGAQIGESFFIDHGTGVVIGETTNIGNDCKVYQGVTLGAKSFPKDSMGRIIRGAKRHPTLRDRVTVYAGATILGGDTVIGDDCVVAGGVFLARSVPPGHIVRNSNPELILRTNPESGLYEYDASGI